MPEATAADDWLPHRLTEGKFPASLPRKPREDVGSTGVQQDRECVGDGQLVWHVEGGLPVQRDIRCSHVPEHLQGRVPLVGQRAAVIFQDDGQAARPPEPRAAPGRRRCRPAPYPSPHLGWSLPRLAPAVPLAPPRCRAPPVPLRGDSMQSGSRSCRNRRQPLRWSTRAVPAGPWRGPRRDVHVTAPLHAAQAGVGHDPQHIAGATRTQRDRAYSGSHRMPPVAFFSQFTMAQATCSGCSSCR